jgi:hypothetical protein
MDFDIPVGKHGDCYDRYVVRMEEMRQAVRIMKQCIEKLRAPDGQGPVIVEDHRIAPPRRAVMKRSMEAMIEQFKLYTEGFHVPEGEVYAAVERRKASSACTWCPTVRTGHTSARSARRPLRICKRWTISPAATCLRTSPRSSARSICVRRDQSLIPLILEASAVAIKVTPVLEGSCLTRPLECRS